MHSRYYANQGGLNGAKPLAPLNPFGARLLGSLRDENGLLFLLAIPTTFHIRRPPKESRGRSESPLGRNIIENKDVPQKMLPEGFQRATVKPLGIIIKDKKQETHKDAARRIPEGDGQALWNHHQRQETVYPKPFMPEGDKGGDRKAPLSCWIREASVDPQRCQTKIIPPTACPVGNPQKRLTGSP